MKHPFPVALIVALFPSFGGIAHARAHAGDASRELSAALAAIGGRDVVSSVHALRLEAVGHRNMLEQSLRPEGPWWQDYMQIDVVRDFATDSERVLRQHRGYSSPQWWLQQPQWVGAPVFPTYVVSRGVVAQVADRKYSPASFRYLQEADEDFSLGPLHVLFTAFAASDLHLLPDVMLRGYAYHVVGFSWHGYPVRIYLNGYTSLPEVVEWIAPRPYDVFWSVWGDVTTRISYGMWSLEPDGLRYPRQWSIERNGLPESDVSITSLTVNPPFNAAELAIPDAVRTELLQHKRTIAELPLGIPERPATEIEPGVVHIPGAWNVNLIRQNDGIIVLEGPLSSGYSLQVLDQAQRRFPGLPVKAVITTSDSWPHIGGLREYVARGIPIYALDLDRPVLTRLFNAPHSFIPDDLERHPRAPRWHLVASRTALGAGANRLELIPYRTATGERQMMVYLPRYRLLYSSDLFAPDEKDTWFTPEYLLELRNAVAREHLDVESIFGMHYDVVSYKTVMGALDAFLSPRPGRAAAAATGPALADDVKSLGFFQGNWSCHGQFPASGRTIASAERFAPELLGHWLTMRHVDQPPFAFKAIEMWRYDAVAKDFENYIFDDAAGIRRYTSPGWEGRRLTWTLASSEQPPDRFVFERRDATRYVVDYSRITGKHTWALVDTLQCERRTP
ncbi:MAG TPA: hypothetical protein VFX20_17090 [Steroidobacteraceae bacterium]|nr:hypothetical protein [Steroidobacteraceae bacterium]